MQFTLDEDQQMIADAVGRFAEERVAPEARARDEAETFPEELLAGLAELGILGAMIDPDHGGAGLDLLGTAVCVEAIARYDASLATLVAGQNAQAALLLAAAGETGAEWSPKLAAGEAFVGWAGPIGDAAPPACAAEADGAWSVTGRARFVRFGTRAAGFVVFADTAAGNALFWVAAEHARAEALTGRLGLRAADTAEVAFEAAPATLLLQGDAVGPVLDDVRASSAVLFGAVAAGVGAGALAEARAYALDRKQFGKPIADFQAIQWKLADVATEVEASQLMIRRAALARGTPEARAKAAQAKLLATDSAVKAGYEAVQIFGGNGFIREFPVERYLRDAKILQASEGATDELRAEVAEARLDQV